jgi:predicted nuclease of restriction endonuclease-like (RecB) superfamily
VERPRKAGGAAAMVAAPTGYPAWLASLKERIANARRQAALAANSQLVRLYHQIGKEILERRERRGWGARVIDRLASDLREAFPEVKGFSSSNLKYMRYFAQACPDLRIGQQPADQLPWFHIVTLLTKVEDRAEREWYAAQAISHAWSRATLEVYIGDRLYRRQGAAITNFARRFPASHAKMADEALKDPYLFDFLGLDDRAHEREIENALVRHITRFLLELGAGFAFVGRQFRLEIDDDEFFIDLLFYHTRIKCYVVVELKAGTFEPDHTGRLAFYLAAVDAQIKAPDDHPTVGLLLCKKKRRLVAEYALSATDKPVGIAEYRLVRSLPKSLGSALPAIEDLEAELRRGHGPAAQGWSVARTCRPAAGHAKRSRQAPPARGLISRNASAPLRGRVLRALPHRHPRGA